MQIGFIRQEQLSAKSKDEKESKVVKWLECYFRIAGVRPFSAKMSVNKNKSEPKHPDYIIYLRANVNKRDSFRDIAIGSLWLGEKFIDGEMKKFMTGQLEVAFTKVAIAVWRAEIRYEGEEVKYLYDIKTMKDNRENDDSQSSDSDEVQKEVPIVYEDIDDGDEIPF